DAAVATFRALKQRLDPDRLLQTDLSRRLGVLLAPPTIQRAPPRPLRGGATGPNCLARSSHIRLHRYQARGTGGFRTTEQNSFGTLNVFLNNQFGPSTTQFTNQT